MSGWLSRNVAAAWMPSSVLVGGIRMSVITTSGSCVSTARRSDPRSEQYSRTSTSCFSCSSALRIPSRIRYASSATTRRNPPPSAAGPDAQDTPDVRDPARGRHGRPACCILEARDEPPVREERRIDAVRHRPQVVQRVVERCAASGEPAARDALVLDELQSELELDPERDELL